MRGTTLVFGLMIASGLAGFHGSPARVMALIPPPPPDACTRYQCKVVHAYWSSEDSRPQWVFAYFEVKDTKESNSYVEEIFTQSATGKSPRILSGKRDQWLFPQCSPMCGKSTNAKGNLEWQSAQEVVRLGMGWPPQDAFNDRGICTKTDDDKGLPSTNQTNSNDSGKSPPQ